MFNLPGSGRITSLSARQRSDGAADHAGGQLPRGLALHCRAPEWASLAKEMIGTSLGGARSGTWRLLWKRKATGRSFVTNNPQQIAEPKPESVPGPALFPMCQFARDFESRRAFRRDLPADFPS